MNGFTKKIAGGFYTGVGLGLGLLVTGLAAVTISGTINSFTSGEVVSAASINENFTSLKSAIEGLPDCSSQRVILNAAGSQSINNSVETPLSNFTETSDTQNMHDPGTNPERITIQQAGIYLVTGGIAYALNASGIRALRIHRNGTVVKDVQSANAGTVSTNISASAILAMTAGEYLELVALQNSGGNLNATPSEFSAIRLCGD